MLKIELLRIMGAVNIHEESKRFALEIIKLYSFLNK